MAALKQTMVPLHRYTVACLTIVIIGAIAAYLLFPALFLDRSLVHDDNLHHGFALLKFHHDVIHQGLSPLWTNMVYGGHALFAEGQAGLSNPVNYLVAWLLRPEVGHNWIHWLGMTGFGIGCFGLARTLSISPMSAFFVSLAATFSSLVIHSNTNMMAIEAMAWVPLTLWAFEAWLRRPRMGRAIIFGLTTSMLIFSGYPHFLHGTVLYMLFSAVTLLSPGSLRTSFTVAVKKYWPGGVVAVLVCVGISCIQWLPLIELASLSHRKSGVGVVWTPEPGYIFRGFIFSINNVAPLPEGKVLFFPNVGSLLVCFLASLSLIFSSSTRLQGQLIATVILLNLGLGEVSPLYRFAASYKLVPGMDSFRIMFPYFIMSTIGIAILAGSALDNLATNKLAKKRVQPSWAWLRWLFILGLWAMIIVALHVDGAPIIIYVTLGAALLGLLVLKATDKPQLIVLCISALLLVEILLLRVSPFRTVDNSLLREEPAAVKHIKSIDNYQQFKHYHIGLVALLFGSPYSEKLQDRASHELHNLVASTNLIWGVPSFSAALALQYQIKPQASKIVHDEIRGDSDQKPGHRLMDVFSIRWVSKSTPESSKHLAPIKDEQQRLLLWENPYARPLVQTYTRAVRLESPEKALEALAKDTEGLLYVEATEDSFPAQEIAQTNVDASLITRESSATNYLFESKAETGYWLFLADTFHPGWQATVDGQATTVFPAQALGKALYVPPGTRDIRLFFQPHSFRVGALVSAFTLLCLTAYGGFFRLRKYRASMDPGT